MTFGAPEWFWAFAILPILVALYLRAERRRRIILREFISPRLFPELAGNVDHTHRAIRFICVLLSIACAITALAKLRWGYAYEDVKRRGLDLLFAVDTSRSMLSNDVSPNRLVRVKLATQDLINDLTGDRIGLIAFAGRAFLQAPLTIDYDAAVESINDLDTKTIPEGGTNISEAIALAVQTFGKTATGNRALIIFTDGEELSGNAVKEAKTAADAGIRIFTVGVGTAQGSLIPIESENGSAFVKDAKGQVVKSRLDENRLREIAQATGGSYFHLENGPQTMRQLYEQGLAKLQAGEIDARLSRRPIERYEWPLAAAILFLAASVFINDRKRRAQPALIRPLATVALVLLASNVFGAAPGIDEYRQQKYDEALRQFQTVLSKHPQNPAADKLAFDSGAAAYKLRDYDNALQAFSQALLSPDTQLQSKGHYNLGNTLYQRGEAQKREEKKLSDWTDALKHYEETLKISPQDKEAKDNYEFVKKKIDELKKKQQEPTPTPPPQQQQQEKKNQQQNRDQQKQDQSKNDQKQNEKDQQQQSQQNQQEQQNKKESQPQQQNNASQEQSSDQQRDQNKGNSSPSPSPSPNSSPRSEGPDNKQKQDQPPSPSNGSSSPTPSQPRSGTSPSPSPTENADANSQPSPTPSTSPEKRPSGDIKAAGDQNDEKQKQEAAIAEAEAEQRGEMSPQQASQLLQAMKDEEARVQLNERKPTHRVYNDW
jgi:Ca-activated chloride channel homolog